MGLTNMVGALGRALDALIVALLVLARLDRALLLAIHVEGAPLKRASPLEPSKAKKEHKQGSKGAAATFTSWSSGRVLVQKPPSSVVCSHVSVCLRLGVAATCADPEGVRGTLVDRLRWMSLWSVPASESESSTGYAENLLEKGKPFRSPLSQKSANRHRHTCPR